MENKFHCPRCRRGFSSESSRDIHVSIYHETKKENPRIVCQYCNKAFYPALFENHNCMEGQDNKKLQRKRSNSEKEDAQASKICKETIEYADSEGSHSREEQVIEETTLNGMDGQDILGAIEVHEDVNIFMYKKYGILDESFDKMKNVDFALGFSTKYQFKLFEQFGHHIVCLDSMHLASKPDIFLTTILIIDSNGVGLPVSWLLSNRVKAVTLLAFLEKFKEAFEVTNGKFPQTKYIMSDEGDNYFKLWRKAIRWSPEKLVSASYVDNSWASKLDSLVKNIPKQSKLHTSLRQIMAIDNPDTAFMHAAELCTELVDNPQTCYFGIYFKHQWLNRIKSWTVSSQAKAEISSNIFIDAFHHLLERKYLTFKTDVELSQCLDALLRYEKDEFLDIEEDKVPQYLLKQELNLLRHKMGVAIGSSNVIKCSNVMYEVRSGTYDSFYEVKLEGECPSEDCIFKCAVCQICPHAVRCSCLDALNRNVVCKHAHAVCSVFNGRTSPIEWDCQIIGPIPIIPYMRTVENLKELVEKSKRISAETPQHLLTKLDTAISEISVILDSLSEPEPTESVLSTE